MNIFSKDFISGTFRASDHGLILGAFSYSGDSQEETGMNISVVEEYVGHNPVPVYLGQKYTGKLQFQALLIKNPELFCDSPYFSQKECRSILRELTGMRGYQWTKILPYEAEDDLWYRTRTTNVLYQYAGGYVAGILLDLECDSCFAWSGENTVMVRAEAGRPFYIFNDTDDLHHYVYPVVTLSAASAEVIAVTNFSDNGHRSEIKGMKSGETITIDSGRQIISSSRSHELLLDDFNLGWFRLIPGKNQYISNVDMTVSMKFRVPRKAGIIQ